MSEQAKGVKDRGTIGIHTRTEELTIRVDAKCQITAMRECGA